MDFIDSAMVQQALGSVLGAWAMGQAIAFIYAVHREQQAQKNFMQAIVAGAMVGSMLMLAIGNSLARGVGIFATMSLIRFRTNLRDPLDMIFIFASFAGGIAAGTGNALAGFVGTGLFLTVMAAMRFLSVGPRGFEAELRIRMEPGAENESALKEALRAVTTGIALLKRRDVSKKETRLQYRVSMNGSDATDLAAAARSVPGVTDVLVDLEGVPAPAGGDDD